MTKLTGPFPIHTLERQALAETLWHMERPPQRLHVQGSERALGLLPQLHERGLAVVGTRDPTPRSAQLLRSWMRSLAGTRLVIVSGFARGIDTIAHTCALDLGLPTVAIMGAGLGRTYPRENEALRERILAADGLLVSEFPYDAEPQAWQFLLRNRIIAAWSKAVWVVEAARRSGALNTAKWARDSHRTCFATPCSPGDAGLAGNQELIDAHHALPFWGPHSLGAVWLEYSHLGMPVRTNSRRSSQKSQEIQNAQLQLFPPTSDERQLLARIEREFDQRGGISIPELMDGALASGWASERFFEALSRLQAFGLLLEKNGLLLKKGF